MLCNINTVVNREHINIVSGFDIGNDVNGPVHEDDNHQLPSCCSAVYH